MKPSKKHRTVTFVFAGLTVLLTGFIFFNSLMPADVSDGESLTVLEIINTFLKSLGIPGEVSNFFVRKAAHFSEFALLAFLLAATMNSCGLKISKMAVPALFIALVVAVTDETIQIFTPGRASLVTDVIVDFSGSVAGFIFAVLIIFLINRHKNKQALQAAE